MTLKNARKLRKLAKFFLVVHEPRKKLGKVAKKRSSETKKFFQEDVDIFCDP